MTYTIRFNDPSMQNLYERFIKEGYHWKIAESKVIEIYVEHGYLKN